VRRHLLGDSETEDYYQRFSNHIICAKPEPEAKLYKHLFCSHLARIIHIFEDNKSLLCYKHVD
jgi:hypothetical protein